MPTPSAPADQAIVDLLLSSAAVIGVPPTDWLTTPAQPIGEESSLDALDTSLDLQIFLDHYRTTNQDAQDGTLNEHSWTFQGRFWIAAKFTTDPPSLGRKTVRAAAADLWRALEANESAFTTMSADEGLNFGPFMFHRGLQANGFALASIDVDVKRLQLHGAT